MARIFLSHSSRNNAQAIALSDWLTANGWARDDIFLDIDATSGIPPGERWQKALNDAAGRCEAVIFLISREWLASRWCHEELALAHKLNKRLFGILIDAVELGDVPARLRDEWQLIDLESGRDGERFDVELPNGQQGFVTFSASGLGRLRVGLVKAGLDPRFFAWPPANDPARAPYRGLAPMEAEDAGIFYGREAATIAALDQLRGLGEGAAPRFMTIIGASGAGKSSFMRAGLVPRLRRDDHSFTVLPILRPERAAISGKTGLVTSIAEAAEALGLKWARAKVEAAIAAGLEGIAGLLLEITAAASHPRIAADDLAVPTIILSLDQAEELFLADGREESQQSLALVTALLKADQPKLIVLATIRTESYEKLQQALAQAEIRDLPFSLPALARGTYQRVIEGPAERLVGTNRALKIEPALTAALLADIEEGGAKDALPLLAFTLERLFADHGGDGDLTLKEYETSRRIAGAIEAAVERALADADGDPGVPKGRTSRFVLLRRAMIPWLAGIDPDTRTARRKVARFTDIPNEARPLIEYFVKQRLLATDVSPTTGERTIEPAHEALLRQWTLLDGWLKEDIAVLATLEGVRRAARDWDANNRDANWLAHAGGRLEDAEAIKSRVDLARRLDATDLDYLEAARAAESGRRDRELDEARKLAEEQRKNAEAAIELAGQQKRIAEQERRNADANAAIAAQNATIADEQRKVAQRTRIGAIATTLLSFFAIGAGIFAFSQTGEARRQAEVAREQTDAAKRQTDLAITRLTQAQMNSSRFLASAAEEAEVKNGAIGLGLALVLEALPSGSAISEDRPLVPEAQGEFFRLRTADHLKALMHHDGGAWSASFSADGKKLVTASDDHTARVWDVKTGTQLTLLPHHDVVILALFSPDGSRVVTASADGLASVWNAKTGAQIASMKHNGRVRSAAFSPDGTQVVSASEDATARVWNAETGTQIAALQHEGWVISASFSPEGSRIVTASADHTARVWDARSGAQIAIMHHDEALSSAEFSPDGTRIVTASGDRTARIWDAETGTEIRRLSHEGPVYSATFSPDGRNVVTASGDNTARVWNSTTGKQIGLLRHDGWVSGAIFSPNGKEILTQSYDYTARVWDVRTGSQMELLRHDGIVGKSAFSPDGTLVATVSNDGTVRLWDQKAVTPISVLQHEGPVQSAALSRDGSRVVTASADGTARVWDANTGTQIALMRHQGQVNAAAFSPDDSMVITASADKTVGLWNAATGAEIGSLSHEGEVLSIAFSPAGDKLASGTFAGWDAGPSYARVWNVNTHAQIAILQHGDAVVSVVFSPDGRRVLTASLDKTARVWDAETGQQLALMPHTTPVNSASFSPDGAWVLTASDDGTARVWDAHSGAPIVLMQHEATVKSAFFSHDGTKVVTASYDGTARVWDAATGKQLAVFRHEGPVNRAVFSPDGKRVATASGDNAARVWDVKTGAQINLLPHEAPVVSASFSADETKLVTVSANAALTWTESESPDFNIELLAARASQMRVLSDSERETYGIETPKWQSDLKHRRDSLAPCDRLAGHPLDRHLGYGGTPFEDINVKEALAACEIAIGTSEPRSKYELGRALEKDGRLEEAVAAYHSAADAGYPMAFYGLGMAYQVGRGVAEDDAQAFAFYNKAFALGEPAAGSFLGQMYWNGKGTAADTKKAMIIWEQAAEQGDPTSHEWLAWVAELGRNGMPSDLAAALYHYAVSVHLCEESGIPNSAINARYRRATLARNMDPKLVADEWLKAQNFVVRFDLANLMKQ
ncbi:PQQ-binding-like beta-propeller repeat protein [Mesorhizobium sp. AR02]|uniref:nSTAND1 domain-containing NTPase n=1 Tax=Mesorhizobium sp. AR02 TaxID=2865837 RepID=UPI00215F4016|nr:PQQ-binding-like beta-propeller repeat protein [Mesorhizobium sp. AR02]UVK55372.1 PQQ-binding-like beta-propeller repeat protein [Mesorhizobium sp. AR02]